MLFDSACVGREGSRTGQGETADCHHVPTKAWVAATVASGAVLSWGKGVTPSLSPDMDRGRLQGEGVILGEVAVFSRGPVLERADG